MSDPYLLPETLDYVVDLLHDNPKTLKECCRVSKSWVPRTRKYLFANITFRSADNLDSWKKTFPDPSTSPAYHARTLLVGCPQAVTEVDGEEGGWMQTFSHIERLVVRCTWTNFSAPEFSLVPFHKFSRTLKSLCVTSLLLPHSQIFSLVRSLPLLEDLTLIGHGMSTVDGNASDTSPTIIPSTSPALTGTLELLLYQGMLHTTRLLLDLPSGLHFRKLSLSWCDEGDLSWMVKLVAACSNTLECLDVTRELYELHTTAEESTPGQIDLSKATKLRDIVFRCGSLSSEWIVMALETITPRHQNLQRISIHIPQVLTCAIHEDGFIIERIEEANPDTQWLDLDRLLVQFWSSRSIRPEVVYPNTKSEGNGMRDWAGYLLPEMTMRGIVDLVEESSRSEEHM